ncbi:hypothetical protein V6Z11_A10G087700 [Gossypium hirsutum]
MIQILNIFSNLEIDLSTALYHSVSNFGTLFISLVC